MGSEDKRRIGPSYEQDVWEARHYTVNAAARCMRYAKRVIARRERREEKAMLREADDGR